MEVWPGGPYPLGASYNWAGTNFAQFSEVAERLFNPTHEDAAVTLPGEAYGSSWSVVLDTGGGSRASGQRDRSRGRRPLARCAAECLTRARSARPTASSCTPASASRERRRSCRTSSDSACPTSTSRRSCRRRPARMHGYDVVDHTPRLRRARRRGRARRAGRGRARARPRHRRRRGAEPHGLAGAGAAQRPAVGRAARTAATPPHAHWFDVDWEAGGGRIGLPVLGEPLERRAREGRPAARRGERRAGAPLPRPRLPGRRRARGTATRAPTWPPCSPRQHYVLAGWRERGRGAQLPPLLRRRHADRGAGRARRRLRGHAPVLLDLNRRGVVDGFRIDHPDGLADPAAYLERLRAAHAAAPWVGGREDPRAATRSCPRWACDGHHRATTRMARPGRCSTRAVGAGARRRAGARPAASRRSSSVEIEAKRPGRRATSSSPRGCGSPRALGRRRMRRRARARRLRGGAARAARARRGLPRLRAARPARRRRRARAPRGAWRRSPAHARPDLADAFALLVPLLARHGGGDAPPAATSSSASSRCAGR